MLRLKATQDDLADDRLQVESDECRICAQRGRPDRRLFRLKPRIEELSNGLFFSDEREAILFRLQCNC